MSFLTALEEFHADDPSGGREESDPLDTLGYAGAASAVQSWLDAFPRQTTKTDILRASRIHDVCPREYVLNYWQPKRSHALGWRGSMFVTLGTCLHQFLQDGVLGPMGVLSGDWEYVDRHVSTGVIESGFHPDPERAVWEFSNQRAFTWRYVEPQLWHEGWRISGHIDGIVSDDRLRFLIDNLAAVKKSPNEWMRRMWDIPLGRKKLLEIKTSGGFVWDKLEKGVKGIADYYRMQASIYQKLSGVHSTLFWYVNRDRMESRLLNYQMENAFWNDAIRKAEIIWTAIRDRTLPDSLMACKTPKDRRAKTCVFAEECWARRFDFESYCKRGEELAAEEGREMLDLSAWVPPME